MILYDWSAGALACNAGSSGVTELSIPELELVREAVSVQTDACRRGRLRSRHGVMRSRNGGSGCGSPRVSKGDTSNVRVSPLLTRGLLHWDHPKRIFQAVFGG